VRDIISTPTLSTSHIIDYPRNPVPQQNLIKINQQPQPLTRQAQVRQQLLFVNRLHRFRRLQILKIINKNNPQSIGFRDLPIKN